MAQKMSGTDKLKEAYPKYNGLVDEHESLNIQVQNIITNAGDSNPEIADARYATPTDTTYPTLKNRLDSEYQDLSNEIGSLPNLQTADKSSLVSAINENSDKIGDLLVLQTNNKSSIVNAINEGRAKTVQQGTSLPASPTEGTIFYLTADYTLSNATYKGKRTYQYNGSQWEEQLSSAATVQVNPITLSPGLQVYNNDSDEKGSIELTGMNGRTLVNLLGRDGNCEQLLSGIDNPGTTTSTLDTTTLSNGKSSYKVAVVGAAGSGNNSGRSITYDTAKHYIMVGEIKNGNASGGANLKMVNNGGWTSQTITDSTKFNIAWVKFIPNNTNASYASMSVIGSAGQYANFDAIRVYEITLTEYNAIDTMTADQIATKYPYVDDIKPIFSPYIYRYGRNLLPSFQEWTVSSGSPIITSSYSVNVTASATGIYQTLYYEIPVIGGQTYSFNVTGTATSISTTDQGVYYNVTAYDSTGTQIGSYANSAQYLNASGNIAFNCTANVPSNAVKIRVIFGLTASTTGTAIFNNPMLNLGSIALPHEVRNDDYLFLPNLSLHSSTDGTVYDSLFTRDGSYRKLKRFGEANFDGSLAWSFTYDNIGSKAATVDANSLSVTNTMNGSQIIHRIIKYDGKILLNTNDDNVTTADKFSNRSWASPKQLIISISDTDSGWGETYTPTAGEIQAYFYGWRMYDNANFPTPYPGTGTKAWAKIDPTQSNGIQAGSGTQTLPTTVNDNVKWKPYRLVYQLAQSTEEPVTSEGQITLSPGSLNQIEVGCGVIVRELAKPYNNSTYYLINSYAGAESASQLTYRNSRIISIYKGQNKDNTWELVTDANTYGVQRYRKLVAQYDQTQAYQVTYLALDTYLLGTTPQTISAQIGKEALAVIQKNVQDIADLTTRVDVVQNTYVRRDQPSYIAPTLLNAWVNYGSPNGNVGYMKDEMGFVHIRGLVKSGVIIANIFILPAGYRPIGNLNYGVVCNNGTSIIFGSAAVDALGGVSAQSGANTWFSLDNIPPFRAEQ